MDNRQYHQFREMKMSLLFSKKPQLYFDMADAGGGTGELGIEESIKLLGDEEEKPEVLDLPKDKPKEKVKEEEEEEGEDKGKKKDEEEEEIDELKEIEDELKEPTEEDLELMTPVRRREILAKFPTLFKEFPYLEKAYYREQQFTEIFPTIPDAKEASEKAATFEEFSKAIMGGDISTVLSSVKEEDPNVFNQVVDGYLDTLRKVDQSAFFHVIGNTIKDTITTMRVEGQKRGEDGQPLIAAAHILNQFVFGTTEFVPSAKLTKPEDIVDKTKQEKEAEVKAKEFDTKFNSVMSDLQTRADNVLKATISGNIDPKNSMTDYVKRNATRDAFETLENLISKDSRFRSLLDKLWDRAGSDGFSKESQDRIKSAYLSKAKTLLPTVIKAARNDALKGLGKRVKEDVEEEPEEKENKESKKRSSSSSVGNKKTIPTNMRTIDFLSQD
jgi:hypothetical protein